MPSFQAKLIGSPIGPVHFDEITPALRAAILGVIRDAGVQIDDQGLVDDAQAPAPIDLPAAVNAQARAELELTDDDLKEGDSDFEEDTRILPVRVQFDRRGGRRKTRKGRKGKSRKTRSRRR